MKTMNFSRQRDTASLPRRTWTICSRGIGLYLRLALATQSAQCLLELETTGEHGGRSALKWAALALC